MISEVDIRDWERSIGAARVATDKAMDRADNGGLDHLSFDFLKSFIDKVEAAVYLNQKQVPALFKAKV